MKAVLVAGTLGHYMGSCPGLFQLWPSRSIFLNWPTRHCSTSGTRWLSPRPLCSQFSAINRSNCLYFISLQDVTLANERIYVLWAALERDKIFIHPRTLPRTQHGVFWSGWTTGVWKRWRLGPLKLQSTNCSQEGSSSYDCSLPRCSGCWPLKRYIGKVIEIKPCRLTAQK